MKPLYTWRKVEKGSIWILACLTLYGLSGVAPIVLMADEGWRQKADMPTARYNLSTSVVNGRIYAIGGRSDPQWPLSAVEEYNPATDSWTRMADMPTARHYLSTSVVDGKIYAIGGRRPDLDLRTVEEYDPLTDTWTEKADMHTARSGLITCAVDGRIYAIGGGDAVALSDVEEYDPLTDTWSKKKDMPAGTFAAAAGVVGGRIYVIGGRVFRGNMDTPVPTVMEYDPLTDTWTRKKDMPQEFVAWGRGCAVNGEIYIFGGWEDAFRWPGARPGAVPPIASVRRYDPATDTWARMMDMPSPRSGMSASTVNGKIYVIGGSEGLPVQGADMVVLDIVEEYTPEGWPFAVFPREKLATKWGSIKQNKR